MQQTKLQKIGFNMHFGFNNQFIKVTRTWPIFQKNSKNLFCFLLKSRITNLHVRHTPNIKISFLVDVKMIRFYPIR